MAAAAPLKLLYWQGAVHLNPHFAGGTKEQEATRMFYEPLAGWDAEGNLIPCLATEMPSRANGGVSADGRTVTWKLKRGVTWHDGKPFTADDVVFTWQYAGDPATSDRHRRHLPGHQGREGRLAHRAGDLPEADAVLGRGLRRQHRA